GVAFDKKGTCKRFSVERLKVSLPGEPVGIRQIRLLEPKVGFIHLPRIQALLILWPQIESVGHTIDHEHPVYRHLKLAFLITLLRATQLEVLVLGLVDDLEGGLLSAALPDGCRERKVAEVIEIHLIDLVITALLDSFDVIRRQLVALWLGGSLINRPEL